MTCPICAGQTVADYRPFCSRRCADVDLAHWLMGSYAIPSEEPAGAETPRNRARDGTDGQD